MLEGDKNFVYRSQLRGRPRKSRKKMLAIAVIMISLGCYGIYIFLNKSEKVVIEQVADNISVEQEKNENVVSYTISEGDIPADLFSVYGKFDANDTQALIKSAEGVYDLTNVKMGKTLRFYFGTEARAERMEYDRDTEKMIIAERSGDNFNVHEEKIPYEISHETVKGKIDNFFYVDAMNAGLSESTVLEIGDLFSFGIDFTTEIRQGDTFSVVYEKRTRKGEQAPDGNILAAKFVNEGVAHYAYYFENGGEGGYYDGDGFLLERQFLKAPLSYRRITSGFTGARYHPITRTVSAHYQIDYAAASGTPVVSTARGTVVSAGWEGGWGNMVRLRHDNGYATHYGHLSAFAKGLKNGTQVAQGEVIGYVGSTGWSTGPHLDYGMKLNGSPINPLKLELPKGKPVNDEKRGDFERVKNSFTGLLE